MFSLSYRKLNQRLHQIATDQGTTESFIIREALEEYLVQEQRRSATKGQNPVLRMIGMFEGAETQLLLLHKLGIDAGQRFSNQLIMQVDYGFVKVLPVTWDQIVPARKIIMK
ncbi:MAG: ribbon-helix-helix domain-containing protein [Firmicutes bacterium]|nr:ribbon-helix-helix domain-containing protein [Bacillota bacterium]